jgi:hypothetical protein
MLPKSISLNSGEMGNFDVVPGGNNYRSVPCPFQFAGASERREEINELS